MIGDGISIGALLKSIKTEVMGWINQAIVGAALDGVSISLGSVAYLDRVNTFSQHNNFSDGISVPSGGISLGQPAAANIAGRLLNIEDEDPSVGGGVGVRFRNTSSSPDKTYTVLATESGDLVLQDDSDGAPAIYLRPTDDRVTVLTDNLMLTSSTEPGVPSGGKPIFLFKQISSDPSSLGSNSAGIFARDSGGNCVMAVIDEAGNIYNLEPFAAASSGAAGSVGLVPQPAAGDEGKFLRGDSTWQTPGSGNTYNITPNNELINGGYDFFQRQNPASATARSDDTYGPDRWYILTQTAAVNCERSTGDTAGRYAVKLTQNQASAQRLGIAQIIEGVNSQPYRSQTVRFQARVKISNSQAVRIAILEWTGTMDSVTSDVVNDWTNGTFTAGNFFKSTTTTVTAVSSVTPSAATWTDISVSGTCGSSTTNIIVIIWVEGTAAQNVTLEVTQAGFYVGNNAMTWAPRPTGDELELCQRYYQKSYAVDSAPGTTWSGGTEHVKLVAVAGTLSGTSVGLMTRMRATPTLTVYDHSGNSGKISYNAGAGWVANATPGGTYATQTTVEAETGSIASLITMNYAWVVEAEL